MARSAKTAKKNIKVVVKGDLKAIIDAGYTVKYKFYRSTKNPQAIKAVLTKSTDLFQHLRQERHDVLLQSQSHDL